MAEQPHVVAHQQHQEIKKDGGPSTNSQRGVTWSETNDSTETEKADTPLTVDSTGRHKGDATNDALNKTT